MDRLLQEASSGLQVYYTFPPFFSEYYWTYSYSATQNGLIGQLIIKFHKWSGN